MSFSTSSMPPKSNWGGETPVVDRLEHRGTRTQASLSVGGTHRTDRPGARTAAAGSDERGRRHDESTGEPEENDLDRVPTPPSAGVAQESASPTATRWSSYSAPPAAPIPPSPPTALVWGA